MVLLSVWLILHTLGCLIQKFWWFYTACIYTQRLGLDWESLTCCFTLYSTILMRLFWIFCGLFSFIFTGWKPELFRRERRRGCSCDFIFVLSSAGCNMNSCPIDGDFCFLQGALPSCVTVGEYTDWMACTFCFGESLIRSSLSMIKVREESCNSIYTSFTAKLQNLEAKFW